MPTSLAPLAPLLLGTLLLRPYVFGFLAVFAGPRRAISARLRMLGFLVWGFAVAFAAEYASTRVGVPFGLYHYTGATRGIELYLGNVPFFDSLSFPFLAYASFCLARRVLGPAGRGRTRPARRASLMMLLDVVIDPLAVRGDRWFLGRIFYYPDGGRLLRRAAVQLRRLARRRMGDGGRIPRGDGGRAIARAGRTWASASTTRVLLFNLAITWWIGEMGSPGDGNPDSRRDLSATLYSRWRQPELVRRRREEEVAHERSGVADVDGRLLRDHAEAPRTKALSARPHARAAVPLQPRLRGLRQDPVPGPGAQEAPHAWSSASRPSTSAAPRW